MPKTHTYTHPFNKRAWFPCLSSLTFQSCNGHPNVVSLNSKISVLSLMDLLLLYWTTQSLLSQIAAESRKYKAEVELVHIVWSCLWELFDPPSCTSFSQHHNESYSRKQELPLGWISPFRFLGPTFPMLIDVMNFKCVLTRCCPAILGTLKAGKSPNWPTILQFCLTVMCHGIMELEPHWHGHYFGARGWAGTVRLSIDRTWKCGKGAASGVFCAFFTQTVNLLYLCLLLFFSLGRNSEKEYSTVNVRHKCCHY